MSTVPTSFRAKDGLFYPSYVEMVNANIRFNQQVLAEKGLDQPMRKWAAASASSPPARRRPVSRVVSPSSSPNSTTPEQRRSSNRLRKVPSLFNPEWEDPPYSKSSKGKRRATNDDDDPNGDVDEEEVPVNRPRQRRKEVPSGMALTEDQRLELSKLPALKPWASGDDEPQWLREMEDYLLDVEKVSIGNFKGIMPQVRKLVSPDEGITYKGWKEGTVFGRQAVLLSHDFIAMYERALDFEDEHGRDKGNGWLLKHPIKKLTNFQHYYYFNIKAPKAGTSGSVAAEVSRFHG